MHENLGLEKQRHSFRCFCYRRRLLYIPKSWRTRPVHTCRPLGRERQHRGRQNSFTVEADVTDRRGKSSRIEESDPVAVSDSDASRHAWQWEASQNALATYTIFFGLLALGQFPQLRAIKFAELPYFLGLACLTIYIGAHKGLTKKMRQQIDLKQGALAPLAASAALFGGFLLVKYLPWINLQTACDAYFWFIGSAAVIGAIGPPLRRAAGPFGEVSIGIKVPFGLLLDEEGEPLSQAEIAPSDILSLVVGLTAASLDIAAGHQNYTFNNLLACLICCDILQLIGLRSFRTAAVLLFGLLAYDVFWVFGSPRVIGENVMLTVATSKVLSGPTRLLFPRAPGSLGEASSFPFSLLGLGDIAVPGLLACLALRFDSFSMQNGNEASIKADSNEGQKPENSGTPLPVVTERILRQRPYFVTTMVAYVGGLAMAFGFNAITHLGQPALLYLVPCCLGSLAVVAAARGDLQRAIDFTDTSSVALLQTIGKKQQEQQGK